MNSKILFVLIFVFSCVSRGETNHKVPLFLSLVLPGGGQIYNKKFIKAGVYIAVESIFIYGAIIQDQRLNDARDELSDLKQATLLDYQKINNYEFLVDRYKRERNNFIWLSIGAVLLSAGDAYVDSYFSDFKRDIFKKGDKLSVAPMFSGVALKYSF